MTLSPAYQAALVAHTQAIKAFTPVQEAYRALAATDDQYLAARAIMDLADAAFDVAFALEQDLPEPTYELDADLQLNLLD